MRTLWAASLRHLLRHPAQLALALLGLALGVATITAVDIATASSGRAFELSMQAVNGAATHELTGGPGGIDEQLYVTLRTSGTPIRLAPVVEGYVVVAGQAMQLIGIDPVVDVSVRRDEERRARREASPAVTDVLAGDRGLERAAAWFTEPGAVVMARQMAARLGIALDAPFQIRLGGFERPAHAVALVDGENLGFDSLLLTDISQAQEWLGLIGKLSRIDVRVPSGAEGERALGEMRRALPAGVELRQALRRAQQNLDMTAAFTTNLQAMSLLALLVGIFLIYSAISFAVVQRRRVIGVLRALGATRSGVLAMVLTEAAILGIVGAGIGVVLGALMGRELVALVSRTINDLYFVVAVNEVVLPPASLAKAFFAGLVVALLAAALPAIEVANSAPQLGMRRSVIEARAATASRWLMIASVVFAATSGVIVLVSERSLFAGFVALFLLLISVAALTPAVLRILAHLAARAAGRVSPIARLAFGDIAASLSRTGVAVAALGLAVAAMIGVGIMVESFRESLRDWLLRTVRADVYVTAPGPGFGRPERRLDPAVIEALLRTPGVADHSESRRVIVDSPRGPVPLDALHLIEESRAAIPLTKGEPREVWTAFDRGAVVISEPLAWRLQLDVGDHMALATSDGAREFDIAGVYREYGNDRGNVLIDRAVYSRLWRDESITALGLYLEPGADSSAVIARLREATAGLQSVFMTANADMRDISMRIFERTFVITRVLYWLAAGVAAIGLVSALLAWELERSRELAIVRALGLTPRGTGMLIEAQSAFMGLTAFVAAIPAGLLTALLLIAVINRRAFGWEIELHVTAAQFTNAALLALAAALAGGLYPAWRSARAPLAEDIREE
jgi:putative ABC transport system permease protein